ncbi:coiled-coil domain-containing protein [Paenibacillus xanthanilyticus]|uniref:Coiled-coil domain-containing protein n=1 Tax=Paenibacillus xanthanilyticus TaxID=1783531 RepID=A0ABV8KCZ3_9BACL
MSSGTIRRGLLAAAIGAAALWLSVFPIVAAPQEEEDIRQLLEKSLSVVELDKEIARIAEQQTTVAGKLEASREALARQEASIATRREEAGSVLRAYYMGDRDFLLTALVSSKTLDKLLATLDYFDVLFASDRKSLHAYAGQYQEIKKAIGTLENETKQLDDIESRLRAQRERLAALQQDVDANLSGRSDEEKLRLLIDEMTNFWKNVGFYEVKRYFKALSQAMKNIPSWVQDNKDMLAIDGFNYTMTIPEDKLNEFLREQNELFQSLDFRFGDDMVTVAGKRDGLEVELSGHYTVENEPKNGIYFHVDELMFNGLALPETTRQSLQQEFDLGFYPQKIVSFLRADSVQVKDGNLIIQLSIRL